MAEPHVVDVVVLGAGPAGNTVATLLKREAPELRVALVERESFPRHHIGESTLPSMNPILAKMGALEKIDAQGFLRKCGINYQWRRGKIFGEEFSQGKKEGATEEIPDFCWQVERSRYDAVLLEHSRSVGVEVLQGSASEVHAISGTAMPPTVRGLTVSTADGPVTFESRFVVDCTGQSRFLARKLGLPQEGHNLGDLALYRYYEGFRWNPALTGLTDLSKIYICAVPAGWFWFIPLSQTLVSCGLVTRKEFLRGRKPAELYDEQLANAPELLESLAEATLVAAPNTEGPPKTSAINDWSSSVTPVAGPGWYLAGDAAAFIDPILSSGIMLAHQAGMLAANAVLTELRHPEIEAHELHAHYDAFYRDLREGFVAMAQWWYENKAGGIEDWWKTVKSVAGDARGAVALSDRETFVKLLSGYLADFRFVNVGAGGFGREGISDCYEGVTGDAVASEFRTPQLENRELLLRRTVQIQETEWYLATDVDANRWRRLPVFHLQADEETLRYRPPVHQEEQEEDRLQQLVALIHAILDEADGKTSIEQVIRSARRRCGEMSDHWLEQKVNHTVVDLLALGALATRQPKALTESSPR